MCLGRTTEKKKSSGKRGNEKMLKVTLTIKFFYLFII